MNIVFIIILIGLGIFIFISPFFGLLITVSLIPFAVIQAIGYSLFGIFTMATPIKFIGGFTFVSSFIKQIAEKRSWSFLRMPQVKFFILFLLLIYASGFMHPGFATRENFTSFISSAMLGFIILALIKDTKKFRLVLWVGLISIFIVSLKNIFGASGQEEEILRISGGSYGPNEFAVMLLPFLGIAFYNVFAEKNKLIKFFSLFIAIALLIALIMTLSRGGIIGLVGMLFIGALKSKRKIMGILSVIALSILLVRVMPQQVWERFEKTRIEERSVGDIASTTRRFHLAKAAWEMFLDYPVFGVGVGNYYYKSTSYEHVRGGRAHNMYLEVLAELGIFGFMAFMGIIFSTLKSLKRIIKSNPLVSNYARGLYIGILGFLFAALFLHAQQEKTFWFFIFMSAALERIAIQSSIAKNHKKLNV